MGWEGDHGDGVPSPGEGGGVVAVDGVEVVAVQGDAAGGALPAVGAEDAELEHAPLHRVHGPLADGLDVIALDGHAPAAAVQLLELVQGAGEALLPRQAHRGYTRCKQY